MPIPKVRESCLTRELVEQGRNIDLQGLPKDHGVCHPCNDVCCDYIGPKCGCNAHNCVDIGVDPVQQDWNMPA